MLRRLSILSLALTLLLVIGAVGLANVPMPKPPQDWTKAISENPIDIATVGQNPSSKIKNVNFVSTSHQELMKTAFQYDALWISDTEKSNFTTEEGINFLDQMISNGKVVLIVGDSNPYDLFNLFGFEYKEELDEKRSNVGHIGHYIWKTGFDGDVKFGIVGATLDASDEVKWNSLLEQTVNHLEFTNSNFPDMLVRDWNPFSAGIASADTLTLSSEWVNKWDQEYNWSTSKGNKLNEWKRIWAISAAHDKDSTYDYFHVRLDDQFVPVTNSSWYADLLLAESVGDANAGQQLYDYGPTSSPGTGTVSWGFTVDSSGMSASSSASWNVSELTITDKGDYSTELFRVLFNYTDGDYAQNTSRQYPAWIYRVPENDSPSIDNYREAWFTHWWYTDESIIHRYTTNVTSK